MALIFFILAAFAAVAQGIQAWLLISMAKSHKARKITIPMGWLWLSLGSALTGAIMLLI